MEKNIRKKRIPWTGERTCLQNDGAYNLPNLYVAYYMRYIVCNSGLLVSGRSMID